MTRCPGLVGNAPLSSLSEGDRVASFLCGGVAGNAGVADGVPLWDITTFVALPGEELYVGGEEGNPTGIHIDPAGARAFMVGAATDRVKVYDLASSHMISSGLIDLPNVSPIVGGAPQDVWVRDDGLLMLVTDNTTNAMKLWTLSPDGDLTSAVGGLSLATGFDLPTGAKFNPDGTRVYAVGDITKGLKWWDLPGAYDFNSPSLTGTNPLTDIVTTASGMFIHPTGKQLFVADTSTPAVHQWTMADPWNPASLTEHKALALTGLTNVHDLEFAQVGGTTYMYVVDQAVDKIIQYAA